MAYKKGDPEYRSNGHYVIDGVDWFSIWAYKKDIMGKRSSTQENGNEAKELIGMGKPSHPSIPDFGGFDTIFIFRETDLNAYYD
jgi:hypothetical protein